MVQPLMLMIPEPFKSSLQEHFGDDIAQSTLDALLQESSVSVRVNPLKPTDQFKNEKRVPWAKNGFLLNERPVFALDPLFHAGSYYVQDSSSMILEKVMEQIAPNRDGLYLDACAAPGGKSTILLDYLDGKGFLIANEVDGKRNSILRENLLKWGRLNVAVTSLSSDRFYGHGCEFDLILVDAPCSGEGMFRKDKFALTQWNENLVHQCAITQRNILDDLSPCLKEGGILIYSTCTMNRIENENQIKALVDQGEFEVVDIDLSAFSKFIIPAYHSDEIIGYYLLPGKSTGEGLFISALKKITPNDIPKSKSRNSDLNLKDVDEAFTDAFPELTTDLRFWEIKEETYAISNHSFIEDLIIPLKMNGLPVYQMKGKNVIPLHGLAMIQSNIQTIELNLENSLRFLRKESISLPPDLQKGWQIVAYKNVNLGWIKIIDQRSNNYYPGWLRLRM